VWQCALYWSGSILSLTIRSLVSRLDKRPFCVVLKDRCDLPPVSVKLQHLQNTGVPTHTHRTSKHRVQTTWANVTSYYNSCITVELQWQTITMQYSTNLYTAYFCNFPIQVPIPSLMKTTFVKPKHVAVSHVR